MTTNLLYNLAEDLLDATAATLVAASLTVPNRRFVDTGDQILAPVAVNGSCEDQLSVNVGAIDPARPPLLVTPSSSSKRPCAHIWQVTLTTTVFRCHEPAADHLPGPAVLDDAGRAHLLEGWVIASGLAARWASGELFRSYQGADCSVATLGSCRSIGPSGAIRGWSMPVTVLLTEPPPRA